MQINNPTVSIIMNCLNCEKYLREAIDSVYAQTYTDWEIVFWDNSSTDCSADIAQSYDNKLRYYRGDKTIPLGAARNKALEKCRGDFIAFLDCDDIWMSEKLDHQVKLFDNTKVGVVYTLTKRFNSEGFIKNNSNNLNVTFSKIDLSSLIMNYDITMSSTMISRNALNSLSYYYDEILQFAEEYDLFLRICYLFDIVRLNEIQTYYRLHQEMASVKSFRLSFLESEYIISKMKLIYPDFENKYASVLYKLEIKKAWAKFLYMILKGRSKSGRKYLMPYIGKNIKYLIAFLLSYFGSKIIRNIWNNHNRRKGLPPIIS